MIYIEILFCYLFTLTFVTLTTFKQQIVKVYFWFYEIIHTTPTDMALLLILQCERR